MMPGHYDPRRDRPKPDDTALWCLVGIAVTAIAIGLVEITRLVLAAFHHCGALS